MAPIALGAFVVVCGVVLFSVYLESGKERVIPPGYVWSEEHQHMHRVGTGHLAIPDDAVWVPEHGHFHDSDGNPIGSATPTPDSPPTPN
jgi:hypothetical protein